MTGQLYTYADVQRKSFRLANSLRKCGFKRGETVAIVLVNCPDYPVVILGALEAELAICFVNHSYTAGRYCRAGNRRTTPPITLFYLRVLKIYKIVLYTSFKKLKIMYF